MNILFPGRHHLLTNFQFNYIDRIVRNGLKNELDVNGNELGIDSSIDSIIFAVTSANHSNTRRNPLPLYLRAMALQEFSASLPVASYIFDIDDVGNLTGGEFAGYTVKKIENRSNGQLILTPENTIVLCSTPVLEMYELLGFKILPAELIDRKTWRTRAKLPWEIVETIANLGSKKNQANSDIKNSQDTNPNSESWKNNPLFWEEVHPASRRLWFTYDIGSLVRILFHDKVVGDDGDLTETRDYNSYVRQMDNIMWLKFNETSSYIRNGRIGDIGCAVGSWIKLACQDQRYRESDFYGVEVSRRLYDMCEQRKGNNDFESPYVFFSKKNAVTGLVFAKGSMNTIHTSSLTHEIESYAGRDDLLIFIKNRYEELAHGGVWINRDVVGPENKHEIVYLKLTKEDGIEEESCDDETNVKQGKLSDVGSNIKQESDLPNIKHDDELKKYLDKLSTYAKFLKFVKEFRHDEGYRLEYQVEAIDGVEYIKLKLSDACEFMSKKDYTDNWESEMHETFSYWSFNEWKSAVEKAGFRVNPESREITNEWIVENRLKGKVELYIMREGSLVQTEYPVTHMVLIAEK